MIQIGDPVKCASDTAVKLMRDALKDLAGVPADSITLFFREDGGAGYDDGSAPDSTWAQNLNAATLQHNEEHEAAAHDAADGSSFVHYAFGIRIEDSSAIVVTKDGCAFFPDATHLHYWLSYKREGRTWPTEGLPNCFPIHWPDTTGHDAIALSQTLTDLFATTQPGS